MLNYHNESCRAVQFSNDGNLIYTASADKSIAVIANGQMAGRFVDAHDCPVHSLVHLEDGNLIASGDDDGVIKVWDLRMA